MGEGGTTAQVTQGADVVMQEVEEAAEKKKQEKKRRTAAKGGDKKKDKKTKKKKGDEEEEGETIVLSSDGAGGDDELDEDFKGKAVKKAGKKQTVLAPIVAEDTRAQLAAQEVALRKKRDAAFMGYAIIELTENGEFGLMFREWNKRTPKEAALKELMMSLSDEVKGLRWYEEERAVPIVVQVSQLEVSSLVKTAKADPSEYHK
ncbi:hypothetical protein EIP91_006886, partial [Steccherinum ochraceum]